MTASSSGAASDTCEEAGALLGGGAESSVFVHPPKTSRQAHKHKDKNFFPYVFPPNKCFYQDTMPATRCQSEPEVTPVGILNVLYILLRNLTYLVLGDAL